MRVTELIDGVGRMICLARGLESNVEKADQFILGNLRIFDNGPPQILPLPVSEKIRIEVYARSTPVEVWKITRGLQFIDIPDEGQALMTVHAIFAYLISSQEYVDLQQHEVSVTTTVEDPTRRPETVADPVDGTAWKSTVFALAGPDSQTLSIECHTNTCWKKDVFEGNDEMGGNQVQVHSAAIPIGSGSGSAHRGTSFDRRVQQQQRFGSVQSSHSSSMHQPSPSLGPHPASLSSARHGVSPSSFYSTFAHMTAVNPQQPAVLLHQALKNISNFKKDAEGYVMLPAVASDAAHNEDEEFIATLTTYDALPVESVLIGPVAPSHDSS
jgi:hypothetical protein